MESINYKYTQMTKAEIVQKLLDKKQITAEEAVVLLTNENFNGITYIPYNPNPYFPEGPRPTSPPPVWCQTTTQD